MESLEEANYNFQEKFLQVLEKMAPLRKIQPRSQKNGWISSATRAKMVRRDQVRNSAMISSLQEEWNLYKELRNQVNRDVKRDRNLHTKNTFQKIIDNKDTRALYRMTKNILGWTQGGTPETFMKDGQQIKSPKEMAQIQLEAWGNKVNNLKNKLPMQTEDPLTTLNRAFENWDNTGNLNELVFQPVGRMEIVNTLKELGSSHAFGHDEMDGKAMKLVAEAIAAPIEHIVNLSIQNSNFTSRWKIARLIPLHKGGTKSKVDPESYRPIALLPQVSKVVEKIIKTQLGQAHGN